MFFRDELILVELLKKFCVVCGIQKCWKTEWRWEDAVDQDMRILGVSNWKKVALNRDEWAKLLKKARAHQGLSSQC